MKKSGLAYDVWNVFPLYLQIIGEIKYRGLGLWVISIIGSFVLVFD